MSGRYDRPGLLATVTRAAVLDGTPQVIRNAVTHSTARRLPAQALPRDDVPAERRPAPAGARAGAG
ncbi:hypothetical protein [Jiangella anatolica]|uniref:Uncharacterized protein n=1 Tax=Jiangella anatolica TaxID=2670374 RepID=A0A2W2B1M7_9ACTN|nr:hypothetical protein [Jiangella anatolica]PZF81295.1 hypothetical protein C1I92_21785 [Jiangella anatolica]